MREADVAIIGGGPIGLELAAGLKHAGVKFVQFEAGQIGSTLMWWAAGTRFFSSPERIEIAGVPLTLVHQDKATREEYLAYLRGVARQFELEVAAFTRVTRIEKRDRNGFEIATVRSSHGVGGPEELIERVSPQAESVWRARSVVLAIGNMHRPRMLGVPGEDLPHVNHYLDEPHRYFGRRVLVVGGKNSAVEAALRLHRIGARVIMSYRGGEFDRKRIKYWLLPELEWLIGKKMIEFYPRTMLSAIHADRIELARADGNGGGGVESVKADCVLLLTGYVQDSSLFEQVHVDLVGEERAPKFDESTMETSEPGVFVAGTAAGGSQQRAKLFIENSHVHVRRIVRAIAQQDVPWRGDGDFGALEQ